MNWFATSYIRILLQGVPSADMQMEAQIQRGKNMNTCNYIYAIKVVLQVHKHTFFFKQNMNLSKFIRQSTSLSAIIESSSSTSKASCFRWEKW